MCNLFNLFRGRSKFITLFLEHILEKCCMHLASEIQVYKKHSTFTTVLTDHLENIAVDLKSAEVVSVSSV